jgi:hypothetical protein
LLAVGARLPKLQESVPVAIVHPASEPAASIVHEVPPFAGSVSDTVTPVAVPTPSFVTVMRNPIGWPAFTVPASAVFVTTRSPHLTPSVAVEMLLVALLSTVAVTVAVFESPVEHWVLLVVAVRVMDFVVPEAIVPNAQVSTAEAGFGEHADASAPLTAQLRLVPLRSSVRTTPVELPDPPAVTVMSKIAAEPASTDAARALLLMETSGQFTATDAVAGPALSAPAETLALLLTVPQVAVVVGDVTCTVKLDAEARLAFVHVRTPVAIAHVGVPVVPAIVQLRPVFVGTVSVIDTLLALPAPVLLTVTVKPMGDPAVTVAASAVLVIASAGERTALDMIWLSRFPIEAPSARSHLMW